MLYNWKLLKHKLILLQQKDKQVLTAHHYFSRRCWQPLEIRKSWQHQTQKIVGNILGTNWRKTLGCSQVARRLHDSSF